MTATKASNGRTRRLWCEKCQRYHARLYRVPNTRGLLRCQACVNAQAHEKKLAAEFLVKCRDAARRVALNERSV